MANMSRGLLSGTGLICGALLLLCWWSQAALGQWGDQIECVSQSLVGGSYHDVEITAGQAYCAMGYGLAVFDLSDPELLQPLAYYGLPGTTEGVWVEGSTAYLASGTAGLVMVDVTNPANPTFLSWVDNPVNGFSYEVVKGGNYLYLADGAGGLRVYNVASATAPYEVVHMPLTGYARDVELDGNLLYIAAESAGLVIYDVATPSTPEFITQHNTDYTAQGVRKVGNLLYLSDGPGGVLIFDVSDSSQPDLIGRWPFSGTAAVREVEVQGTYAYAADDSLGLVVLNVSAPAFPTVAAQYNSAGYPWSLALNDTVLYLANDVAGLASVSLIQPTQPALLASYSDSSEVTSIWVDDHYAFAARGFLQQVSILDVQNPEQPESASVIELHDPVVEVMVQGVVCYSANLIGGIYFTNVSDPLNPRDPDHRNTVGESHDLSPRPPFLFIADGSQGLVIMNLVQGTAWHLPTTDYAYGVFLVADTAYISQASAGIMTVDVSNPYQPHLLDEYDTPGYARRCVVEGDFIYIADDFAGLTILRHGLIISEYDTPGLTLDVKVAGERAYLADGSNGLVILDISNPYNPRYLGSYPTPGSAQEVFVDGQDIYVADGCDLGIYRFTPTGIAPSFTATSPQTFQLSLHPNPFNSQVQITLQVTRMQPVTVDLFNVSGQRIARMFEGNLGVGAYSFLWKAEGKPSGVYWVAVNQGGTGARQPLILLK